MRITCTCNTIPINQIHTYMHHKQKWDSLAPHGRILTWRIRRRHTSDLRGTLWIRQSCLQLHLCMHCVLACVLVVVVVVMVSADFLHSNWHFVCVDECSVLMWAVSRPHRHTPVDPLFLSGPSQHQQTALHQPGFWSGSWWPALIFFSENWPHEVLHLIVTIRPEAPGSSEPLLATVFLGQGLAATRCSIVLKNQGGRESV